MKTFIRIIKLITLTLIVNVLQSQNMTLAGSQILIPPGSSISITGDIEITGPVLVDNSGEITVGGDWINTAPAEFSLEGTTGKVVFDGTAPQMITGNFPNIFSNLHLHNDVDLDIGITISASLQLEDALLTLNKMDLVLMNAAEILGAGSTAYIAAHGEGQLKQQVGAGEVLFPVGTDLFYLPAVLSNIGTPDLFGVNLFPDVLTEGASGNTIPQIENTVVNTWLISEEVAGGSDLSLTVWWNLANEGTLFDRLQSGIGHYTDGEWHAQDPVAAGGDDPYTLTRAAITQTGAFAAGDISSPMAISETGIEQTIILPQGWSGWSSYIVPLPENDFASVIEPVLDDLIISIHFNQLFYPAFNINTIGQFSNQHGYVIKMAAERTLTIEGIMADPTINLNAGWNLMPVLSPCNLDADELLGNISGLVIAFEVAGNGIYYPQMNINTLQTLVPGKAYYVKVQNDVVVNFPACLTNSSTAPVLPGREKNITPWNDPAYTASSHIVIFGPNAAAAFESGDMIGAFTADGLCAGLTRVTGSSVSMPLFGNDFTASAKNGFGENEPIKFRLYRNSTGEEFTLDVSYDTKAPESSGLFSGNGLSIISSAAMDLTGIQSSKPEKLTVYPNPSTGIIHISSANPLTTAEWEIFDALGQMLSSGEITGLTTIDLTSYPRGLYFIHLKNKTGLRTEKLIIQ